MTTSNLIKGLPRKEYMRIYMKDFRIKNHAHLLAWSKSHLLKNGDRIRAVNSKRWNEIKEYKLELNKAYRRKNPERLKIWRANARIKDNERLRIKRKLARQVNPAYRILHNLRSRMGAVMRRLLSKKICGSKSLIGCSSDDLKIYLESKFLDGMSWENYDFYGWHIDHIIPCASFDLTDPEQQKKCFHYTNLQPLWALDNFRKHDQIL